MVVGMFIEDLPRLVTECRIDHDEDTQCHTVPRVTRSQGGAILATMDGCCDPGGYGALFGKRFSRHLARRYRRGPGPHRHPDARLPHGQGVDGASVLEIGGGVGALQLELLQRGASRATNLELVDSYEDDAAALAAEAGVADRMTRRQVDLATTPTRSSRTTSSCCTGWCAATPTTSGCSAPAAATRTGCWSTPTRRGTRSAGS